VSNRHRQHQQAAATRNAADPKQVARAGRLEALIQEQDERDLEELLALPSFRRFSWRLVSVTRLEGDIWDPSSKIHANAGMQSVGIWFRDQLDLIGPDHYGRLRAEAIRRNKRSLDQLEDARETTEPARAITAGQVIDDAADRDEER
jgi:hypothetical protein